MLIGSFEDVDGLQAVQDLCAIYLQGAANHQQSQAHAGSTDDDSQVAAESPSGASSTGAPGAEDKVVS